MPAVVSRAACVFVLRVTDDGPQVLLLKRADTMIGTWCQVAGEIEANETAWQCVLRELTEETGLTPDRLWSADICEQFYVPARDIIEIIPVFVALVPADSVVQLNAEHTDFDWLTFEQAKARVSFASQRNVLRHLHAEFIMRRPPDHLSISLRHK